MSAESGPPNITSGPREGGAVDPDVTECEQLLAAGDLAAARHKFSALEILTPPNEDEWKRLYSLSLRLNDRTRAQIYTEKFLQICTNSTAAHLACARNFMPVHDGRARARESLTAALKNPRADAGFWREVSEIQRVIEDHEGVRLSATKSLSLDPTDLDLREILISSLGVLRRTREIRDECRRQSHCLMLSETKDPLRWASLARVAAEAKAKKEAKTYIDLAIRYLPNVDYGAEFELIRALILTDQASRAMKHLEHLVEENSQNSWLWKTLVDTAMRGGAYQIALIAVRQLKAFPYLDPEFRYRLSVTERTASKTRAGFLKRIGLQWLCRSSFRL